MIKKNAPQDRGASAINTVTLRDLRMSQKCSIDDVAAAIAVPTERIERWEGGIIIPDANETIGLSEFYGCSLMEVYAAIINTHVPCLDAIT